MKKLTEILKALNVWDINLIKKIYEAKILNEGGKRLKLLNLAIEKEKISDQEASALLYDKEPNPAFVKLKQRLRTDIFNFILMQDIEKLYEAPKARARFDCRRKILVAEFLLHRGLIEIGVKLFKKTLKIAEKYELFWEAIQIRIILRNKIGHYKDLKTYEKFCNEIDKEIGRLQTATKAQELYVKFTLPDTKSLKKDTEYKEYGQLLLEEFDKLDMDSETAQFFYCMGAYYYYFKIEDFYKSLEINQRLEKLVQHGRIYYNQSFRAKCLNSYGELYIHLKQYNIAIPYAKQALDIVYFKTNNWHNAAIIYFYACFYAGNYDAAENVYKKSLNSKLIKKNIARSGYWNYFKAILEFKKGDFSASRKYLHNMGKLPNTDPAGWLLGYKLLELMIFILEEEYELLMVYSRNLNQLLFRHKKGTNERISKILKVIKVYNKNPFDRKDLINKLREDLKILQDDNGPCKWTPIGYELIRFDAWFIEDVLKMKVSELNK